MATEQGTSWHLKGSIIGVCSCDWGCPCNFDARPTNGWCQGTYVWDIQEGRFGDVVLDGLFMSWSGQSPGPLHEGHVTAQAIIDSKANDQQREALLTLSKGEHGGPFAIFATVTETFLEPLFAPFEASVDGLNTKVSAEGILEIGLSTIKNPVSGEPEEIWLVKPTGFTSKETAMGASTVYRFDGGFQHDHSGKYGEFAAFEYSGPVRK